MIQEKSFIDLINLSNNFVEIKKETVKKSLSLVTIDKNTFDVEYKDVMNIQLKKLLACFYENAFNIAGKISLIILFKPAVIIVALIEGKRIYKEFDKLQIEKIKPNLGIILFSIYILKGASSEKIKEYCISLDVDKSMSFDNFEEDLEFLLKLNCIVKHKNNWFLYDIVKIKT